MEHNTTIHNTFHSLQDGEVDADIMGDWKQAAPVDGISGKREVHARRSLLGVGAMAGSAYPYPGVSSRVLPSVQDGAQHQEDDREASFNKSSKAD